MEHEHHIIENHNGVRVKTNKTVKVILPEHAQRHKRNFEMWGFWQDELAYKGLMKMLSKEDIIKRQLVEAGRMGGKRRMTKMTQEQRSAVSALGHAAAWKKHKKQITKTLQENGKLYGHLGGMPAGKYIWINNGKESKKQLKTATIEPGWVRGRHSRSNK